MCMPFAVASVLMFSLNADSVYTIVASMGSMWPAYVIAGFTQKVWIALPVGIILMVGVMYAIKYAMNTSVVNENE